MKPIQHQEGERIPRNWQRGTDRWNARLDPDKVRYIRANPNVKNIALAAEPGCSKSNIEFVKAGITWKHISNHDTK